MNNTVRQIMTDIVQEAAKNQAKVLSGVSGTNTILGSLSPTLDGYSAGMMVILTPAATNTSTVTLNIDSLGAKAVIKQSGGALIAGDLTIGVPAVLVLDSTSTNWLLLNPVSAGFTGSFTATLTGMSGATTGTINYRVVGNVAYLWRSGSNLTGTSNTNAMTMTGLPAAIQPGSVKNARSVYATDGVAGNIPTDCQVAAGTITFTPIIGGVSSTWATSGTKGIVLGWTLSYPLDA